MKVFWQYKHWLWSVCLALVLSCSSEPPPDVADPGQRLFLGYVRKEVDCARCHGPEGQGGMSAPRLQDIFAKYDERRVVDIIELGKGDPEEGMPAFEGKISEEEMAQLLAFLRTL